MDADAGLATRLHQACAQPGRDGEEACAALLRSAAAVVDARDAAGRTPLHYAAACGLGRQVDLLLHHGALVDARNSYGSTPLHLASAAGHVHIARILIAAGAQSGAVNNGGWTPLAYALRGGEGFNQPAVADLLREHGGVQEAPAPLKSLRSHLRPHPAALSPAGYR